MSAMDNNPFRKDSSLHIEDKVNNWGKAKFKPVKFGNGKEKPLNNKHDNRKFFRQKGNSFHKNKKESYKLNEIAKNAKPENATPWNKYKDEITFKQREEEQAALQANMDSTEAKSMLKQREINYRKSLIEQKMQEPVEWEDFEESQEDLSKNNKILRNNANEQCHSFGQNQKFKRKHITQNQMPENKLHSQSNASFKKNDTNRKCKTKEFISKGLLENFDSKKLNYKQNDALRATITKYTLVRESNLESVVKDLKKKNIKKEKSNKQQVAAS